jgi:hypothetical protein
MFGSAPGPAAPDAEIDGTKVARNRSELRTKPDTLWRMVGVFENPLGVARNQSTANGTESMAVILTGEKMPVKWEPASAR